MSSSVPPPSDKKKDSRAPDEEQGEPTGRLGRVTTKSISRAEIEEAQAKRELRQSRVTPDPRVEGEPAARVERVRLTGEFADERTGTRTKAVPDEEE
jgi:hypothetical protein